MASWSTAWHIIETKKNPKILQTQMNTEKLTVKLNSTAVFEINNGPFHYNSDSSLLLGKSIKFGEVLVGR